MYVRMFKYIHICIYTYSTRKAQVCALRAPEPISETNPCQGAQAIKEKNVIVGESTKGKRKGEVMECLGSHAPKEEQGQENKRRVLVT